MKTALPRHNRREFLGATLATTALGAVAGAMAADNAAAPTPPAVVRPPTGKKLLLATKLSMIAKEAGGRKLTVVERLRMAAEAGFDGVDFDEAAGYTPEQVRTAVLESGVFVHNAINHDHWNKRLTSPKAEDRAQARANLEHCLRVSHAAGGSGVLIVVGRGEDGPAEEIEERCRQEILAVLPLAAALGQHILVENVWNRMMYDHDRGPEQTPERFIRFVDSFRSPWVGMYYDVGNHWKYGQPAEWIRAFGHRCVKLDVKGFSRAKNKFTDITGPEDDLPWAEVRKALADIHFHGWATCEVGGGTVPRLTQVRQQMQKAFGLEG
ncbi:MAG: sugar phosphate isomerase/epimerase [Verrucomicrobiae bacterium]|nr:sugar phosphate isomerase/epimerase [Verrucomicrobiae bacterium]